MASINNTNSYGRSGTLGLASGIDSESVIDNMMAAMQNKIDKQKAIRQQILWKQNIYRDVTSELLTMQRNFLNTLNPSSNLRSSSLYVNQTVHVSGTALKASSLIPNNPPLTIESISQLATGKVVRSGESLSKDIQVNVDLSKVTETLKVMLGSIASESLSENQKQAFTEYSGNHRCALCTQLHRLRSESDNIGKSIQHRGRLRKHCKQ